MPLYDYECMECGHAFELRQSFSADPQEVCPRCSGNSRRKFHAVPIIYKGSGFYTTDYKHSSYSPPADEKKEQEGEKKKSKDWEAKASTSETKSEDKKEATKKEA